MAYTFKHGDRPLDGYTIQRAVGRGGFGEVYYALSDGGREVALKYLRDNPETELRGVATCINLKSPHLVSIFDVKQCDDGNYVIIMEYCSGPSLRDLLIAEPNGFPPEKAAFFAKELAKGLSYLHERGIVHRDLKPGNVFYDDGYVKIGDYGLSKFISVSRHSAQTASVGTVHYMAPEIGSGNYSRGVDIYALGVMLYEMLLGKVPFEGSSLAEVLMKHLTTSPEIDELPNPFGRVIRKALEKDPADRYQTVDDMIGDVLDVQAIQESLATFSPKSLDDNVARLGGAGEFASPMRTPPPAPRGHEPLPPFAQPVGQTPLDRKVAKKVDKISRRIDKRIAKLGGAPHDLDARNVADRRSGLPPIPPLPGMGSGASGDHEELSKSDRRKRFALGGLMTILFSVGTGILWGNTFAGHGSDEAGVSAGFSVLALAAGVGLSRKALAWFGAIAGPAWTRLLIQAGCCAPLLAASMGAMMERYGRSGVAAWLGLLAVAVFAKWDRALDNANDGEMQIGMAFKTAIFALIATAIAGGVMNARPEHIIFMNAMIAGLASLILQASNWWRPNRTLGAYQAAAAAAAPPARRPEIPAPAPLATPVPNQPGAFDANDPERDSWEHVRRGRQSAGAQFDPHAPRPRWAITRAFWGLASFFLMGGIIFMFVFLLLNDRLDHMERTGLICGMIGSFSAMIYALRKTTPLKRAGFWRETLRPGLQSLLLAGTFCAMTVLIRGDGYRAVSHISMANAHGKEVMVTTEEHRGFDANERAGLVVATSMSGIALIIVTVLAGRRKQQPKPFLRGAQASARGTGSPAPEAARQETDEAEEVDASHSA